MTRSHSLELKFDAVAQCPRPDRFVEVALLQVRPHLGESLRAYANVTARVGIQMHLKPTRSLVLLDHQIGGVSQQQGSGGSLTSPANT
jgi:hypothetical protein